MNVYRETMRNYCNDMLIDFNFDSKAKKYNTPVYLYSESSAQLEIHNTHSHTQAFRVFQAHVKMEKKCVTFTLKK